MEEVHSIPMGALPGPQKPRSQVWAAVVGGLAGGGGALLAVLWGWPLVRPLVDASDPVWVAVMAVGVAMGAIAAHELGHVLGGWVAGLRFVLLVVGPLRIERTGGRLRVMLNRDLAMAGGVALCVPVRRDGLSARFAVMVGCGPIVSLFLGVASLGMAVWMPAAAVHLKLGAGMLGLLSIGLGLITLFPMPMGDMASDGLRLLRLLCGGEAAARDAALLMVVGQAMLDVRPRDWDREAVLASLVPADGSSGEVTARYFALMHARDRGDAAETRLHADRLLVVYPAAGKPLRTAVLIELVTEAVLSGDADRLRHLLDLLTPLRRLLLPAHREVVAAAELVLAGDGAAAAERLRQPAVRAAYATPYLAELRDQMVESVQRATAAHRPSG